MRNFYAVILAGGAGTRLWPLSRKKTPKHLLKLISDHSMIYETVDRVKHLIPSENIFIITNFEHAEGIAQELPQVPREQIIGEPRGRNTGWAMGLGAYYVVKKDPNAVVINFAADHLIEKHTEFVDAIKTAKAAAEMGDYLVTIGIVPTYPHTGLGYIKIGDVLKEVDNIPVYKVEKFVEKPNEETAQEFVASKNYFWNANLYTWHVNSLKRALQTHAPEVFTGLETMAKAIGTDQEQQALEEMYANASDVQIDKGVSEKASNLLMIEGDFGWKDVGDWEELYQIKHKDANQNVTLEDTTILDLGTRDSLLLANTPKLVSANKKLIAAVGLENIIIVDTPDALLICPRDRVQEVKKIVETLKAQNKSEYL